MIDKEDVNNYITCIEILLRDIYDCSSDEIEILLKKCRRRDPNWLLHDSYAETICWLKKEEVPSVEAVHLFTEYINADTIEKKSFVKLEIIRSLGPKKR
jgi:hypothetical protein